MSGEMDHLQSVENEEEAAFSPGEQQQEIVPLSSQFSLALRIPSFEYHDNYHHPLFPFVLAPINCYVDLIARPTSFPFPLGPLPPHRYNVLGARFHGFEYVNRHPERLFTRYMLWWLEVDDYLFRLLCPSDLNDMPCEWDELQGGCPMLRLCKTKHRYPHPHLGKIPKCALEYMMHCKYVHDIEPSCRSIAKQLILPKEEQFVGWQRCGAVADGRLCAGGHDFESARIDAVYRYWEHKAEARIHGSVGYVKRDIGGHRWLRPIKPVDSEESERGASSDVITGDEHSQ